MPSYGDDLLPVPVRPHMINHTLYSISHVKLGGAMGEMPQ